MGETLRVSQDHVGQDALCHARDALLAGGVVVMPTDSVYGIGCAATPNNPGYQRIFDIKRRSRTQTLPLVVGDASDLDRLAAQVGDDARALARAFWPGALTLVVMAGDAIPGEYVAADGTVALRVPDSPLVRELARAVGPIALTSANTHGAPSPASFDQLEGALVDAADLVLDGGAAPVGVASTIVDCAHGTPRVLREGAVTPAQIELALS